MLHKMLLDMVRADLVCRRLMAAPGVGAVVALTYRATVDQPQRFVHSRAVGAHVGLTPKRYQSGEIDYDGGVSKCGDAPATHNALRSRTLTAYPHQEMVVAEGMGRASGPATRDASSDRRGRQASGCRSAPDVGRR